MWWLDPRDEATFTIHDQFALGDDLIVAPVVERGATTRDIYLTQGRWRDPFAEVTPCRCSMRSMRRCRSADRSAPFSCLCRQLLHGRGNSSATAQLLCLLNGQILPFLDAALADVERGVVACRHRIRHGRAPAGCRASLRP